MISDDLRFIAAHMLNNMDYPGIIKILAAQVEELADCVASMEQRPLPRDVKMVRLSPPLAVINGGRA